MVVPEPSKPSRTMNEPVFFFMSGILRLLSSRNHRPAELIRLAAEPDVIIFGYRAGLLPAETPGIRRQIATDPWPFGSLFFETRTLAAVFNIVLKGSIRPGFLPPGGKRQPDDRPDVT